MTCCHINDEEERCTARRLGDLPMCQRHLMRTFRDALVAGAMPPDVFSAICSEAVEALRVGRMVRTHEMNRTIDGIRLEREQEERRRRIEQANPVVYYVELTGGRIKIGWTTDLARRLVELRLRPDDVLATEPGGRSHEALRHRQFALERIGRSEEFRQSDALRRHIASLTRQDA